MMHMSLPVRLRVLRAERNLKLRDVEAMSGVAKETLSALERGERKAMDSTLAKLAQVYHVDLGELIELRDRGKAEAPQDTGRPDLGHDVYVVAPQVLYLVEKISGRALTEGERQELLAALEGSRASDG